ncbi:MAG TPA: radical SAM protein [Nitrospiria bacterium]
MGRPCIFVRTTGCDLRCSWCDTAYAFYEGREMTIDQVMQQVEHLGSSLVEITGGEPLLQEEIYPLTTRLLDSGFEVLVETNGAHPIESMDKRAKIILDLKCPGSGMSESIRWENLTHLKKSDEVKFVLADRRDFHWASSVIFNHSLSAKCTVLFSPVFGKLDPQDLAQWILERPSPVRLQVQLHKYIWHPDKRGV